MKTWENVEKAFINTGIKYQQKEWIFLCEVESGLFYYSPQSGKWKVKQTRVWKSSDSVEDFIRQALEHIQTPKETKKSSKSKQAKNQKKNKSEKKATKTKTSSSKKKRNYQDLKDEVRREFLELFDEKIRICNECNYKRAWVWKVLLDKYLLTPKEICWLCVVFDYSPGWAFHQTREQHPSVGYRQIWASIQENKREWRRYFEGRWQFSSRNGERQKQHDKQQKRAGNNSWSTQGASQSQRYQSYLDILRLGCPFTRQELKIAYRKKALETHPDTGGTTEAFTQVHLAFEVLEPLASY